MLWMGLTYNGRGSENYGWPKWWEDGAYVIAPNHYKDYPALRGTTDDGETCPIAAEDVGEVVRFVREGGWCWRVRFGYGLNLVDPPGDDVHRLSPYHGFV